MGIWRRAVDWFTVSDARPYSARFDASDDGPARPVDQVIAEMWRGSARVTRLDALSVPAMLRGRNLICSISTLPLEQVGPDLQVARLPLLEQIDDAVPNVVTIAQTVEDLLFEGLSWWRITQFGADGFPMAARHLDYTSVTIQEQPGLNPAPLPFGQDPRGAQVYVDGLPADWSELVLFSSPNPGVLKTAGLAVRRAVALSKAAEMYANDPRATGFFTPKEGADPVDDDRIRELLADWKAARQSGSTAYVPAALDYNSVDVMSPADLQLVELQRQAALEIANALGLDPEDLGVSTTSRTYQNAVDRRRDRINDVLSPYMKAITDRLSMRDVTRRGYVVRFVLDDYLKADPATRANVQGVYLDKGVITVDEVRHEEGLPALSPAQRVEIADRMTPAVREPAAAQHAAPASATFDGDVPTSFEADLPVERFAVDRDARTISGRVVPYGPVGMKNGRRFRFMKGSLQWSQTRRVKLLRDHDYAQAVGRAELIADGADGMDVTFKIARGPEGDRALALAEDGVVDGLSVGVDFTDVRPVQGVYEVHGALLKEVSLVAMPAFDDARVASLVASADRGESSMSDETTAAPETTPSVAPVAAPDLNAAFAAFMSNYQPSAQPLVEQRPIIVPPAAQLAVTEAAPYRFDRQGNIRRGTHEFSSDLIAGLRDRDETAYNRALSFIRERFDATDTTDTAGLNPSRQRPDLYVDQRDFAYPIWDAVNKGTLTDVTPFIFPKFSSATGMVAAHSQGTEPSLADFVVTTQTVTPTALSGKAEINREVWDQGGNPQISNLIWRQMTKGWFEALEAAAVAVLDAASPTQIDFSANPGLANDDLDQALTAAFADLQFVRGGFTMDNLFAQIDFYKALIAATGGDGRRLYPALGPTNANGTVRSRFGAVDINGVTALPAWALAATGSVAASSYLFDSASVHGWASAPQRLNFDYQVKSVFIGIWGYKATAISDINGVREIVYDPS